MNTEYTVCTASLFDDYAPHKGTSSSAQQGVGGLRAYRWLSELLKYFMSSRSDERSHSSKQQQQHIAFRSAVWQQACSSEQRTDDDEKTLLDIQYVAVR